MNNFTGLIPGLQWHSEKEWYTQVWDCHYEHVDPAILIKGQTKSWTHALNCIVDLQWLNKIISSPKSSKVSVVYWIIFRQNFKTSSKAFLSRPTIYQSEKNTLNTDEFIFPKIAHFFEVLQNFETKNQWKSPKEGGTLEWNSLFSTSWERKRVKDFVKCTGILFLFSSKRYS